MSEDEPDRSSYEQRDRAQGAGGVLKKAEIPVSKQ